MGLTPAAWVAFLKGLERQDDRTYHLKVRRARLRVDSRVCKRLMRVRFVRRDVEY